MKKLLLLAAWFCLAGEVRSAVPPAEKLLPEDTQFVISIPDFTKAREIYRTAPQTRLWEDPAMKPFREKFLKGIREDQITPLEHELGVSFDDYTNLPQGQLTFAMVANSVATNEADMVLLIDTKSQSSQLRTNLAELKKKWVDAGKPLRTEKIRDLEFSVVIITPKAAAKTPDNDPPDDEAIPAKPAVKVEYYIGQSESLLIVSTSPKVIEKVLAASSGASVKTLEDVPAYAASHGTLFRQAALYAWLNAASWVDTLRHQDDDVKEIEAESNPFSFKWEKLVSATGLSGLKSVAFNFVNSPEGAEFNVALGVPEAGRTGIFKILAGEPKDSHPPSFIPANAIKFQRWRLDGQKTWAIVQKMLGEVSMQWLNGVNFFLNIAETSGQLKDPDFSIKKNLLGNLGDDIITYSKAPAEGTGADAGVPRSIVLVGSPNGEQLASAVKSVFAIMGEPSSALSEREFRGHKIYSLPQPALPGVPVAPGPRPSLSYASSGGYLALSADAGMLEEYLRSSENQEKSLRENPGFGDATQKVLGSESSLFGYSNGSEDMRATFEALKKNPKTAASAGGTVAPLLSVLGTPDGSKLEGLFDYSLLPPFDQIAKYFYFNVYGGSANSKGLQLKIFMPFPPQLETK